MMVQFALWLNELLHPVWLLMVCYYWNGLTWILFGPVLTGGREEVMSETEHGDTRLVFSTAPQPQSVVCWAAQLLTALRPQHTHDISRLGGGVMMGERTRSCWFWSYTMYIYLYDTRATDCEARDWTKASCASQGVSELMIKFKFSYWCGVSRGDPAPTEHRK